MRPPDVTPPALRKFWLPAQLEDMPDTARDPATPVAASPCLRRDPAPRRATDAPKREPPRLPAHGMNFL